MDDKVKKHKQTAPEALKSGKGPALRLIKGGEAGASKQTLPPKPKLGGQLLSRLNSLTEQIDRDVAMILG